MICPDGFKRHAARVGVLIALSAVASGCVAESAEEGDGASARADLVSGYRCDEDTRMTIERAGGAVHVATPRGIDVDLPAAPPSQRSRFGKPPYALVMNGDDALWMVTGKMPLNCRRAAAIAASID